MFAYDSALAAKDLAEAQKGIAFAAYLKILVPFFVVVPGIAASVLFTDLDRADQAYPSLMNLMPIGLKGLVFAALFAAIVSSLASMCNSISTIFTMDIYSHFKKNESQSHYVKVGRIVSILALIIAMICAKPLLGQFEQAFQYIQEFTGFFTPGSGYFLTGYVLENYEFDGCYYRSCRLCSVIIYFKRSLSRTALYGQSGHSILSLYCTRSYCFPCDPQELYCRWHRRGFVR